jgi:hypothetical protein
MVMLSVCALVGVPHSKPATRRDAEAKAQSAQPPEFMRLTKEAADAFNDCWMKRGRDQPAFAAALRRARALVDDLAAP